MKFLSLFLLLATVPAFSADLPARPTDPTDPGSAEYAHEFERVKMEVKGREVLVYLPKGATAPVPVVVYGHGQAIWEEGYQLTFEHLARKGVAVIFPAFDSGFFDQDWRRMASDFNRLTLATLEKFPTRLDPAKIVYAGHSKGAYIALMAAGAPNRLAGITSLVLFAPAGYDREYLAALDPAMPVSIFWGDRDSIIAKSAVKEIYDRAPSRYKQFALVRSYPRLAADHYFVMSDAYFFGGRKGISPFHYFGAWKWLLGAAWDLDQGPERRGTNSYLYGPAAVSTGLPGVEHEFTRSW